MSVLEPRPIGANLSYSQVHSLEACGWQFALTRMFKVPTRNGWALVGGSAFHRATELYDLAMEGQLVEPSESPTNVRDLTFDLSVNRSVDSLRATARQMQINADDLAIDLAMVTKGLAVDEALLDPPGPQPVWPLVDLPLNSQVGVLQKAYEELADQSSVARQLLVIVGKPASRNEYVEGLRRFHAQAWERYLEQERTRMNPARDLWLACFYAELFNDWAGELSRWEAAGKIGDRPSPVNWKASGKPSREWPDKENFAWWQVNGVVQLNKYIRWREETDWKLAYLNGKPAIELDVTGMLSVEEERFLPGEIQVQAHIDRVFIHPSGDPIIVDLKTGANEPESAEQLGLYASMIENMGLPRPRYGAFWMSKKDQPIYNLRDLSVFDLEYFKWKFSGIKRQRDDGFLYANPQFQFCRTCEVADYCYARGGDKANLVPRPWQMDRPHLKPLEITPVRRAA